ncbi:MAG TPA: MoaD/ThiS family protein [Actinomycetota bacterium]
MKVTLRNPDRAIDLPGGRPIREVLEELGIDGDTVLVIRDGELVTRHDHVGDDDDLEIRPVISGGRR